MVEGYSDRVEPLCDFPGGLPPARGTAGRARCRLRRRQQAPRGAERLLLAAEGVPPFLDSPSLPPRATDDLRPAVAAARRRGRGVDLQRRRPQALRPPPRGRAGRAGSGNLILTN